MEQSPDDERSAAIGADTEASLLRDLPHLHPQIREAIKVTKDSVMNSIIKTYRSCPRKIPEEHAKEAESFHAFAITYERKIGIIGPSGAGKSNLVCSLLRQEGIALAEARGRAVTSFPVHYRSRKAEHKTKFTISVIFPKEEDLGAVLGQMLREYNPLSFIDENEEIDPDEKRGMDEKERAAEDALRALFGSMRGFSLDRFKIGSGITTEDSAKRDMSTLVKKLPFPLDMKNGTWDTKIEKISELRATLKRFRSDGLWPIIESVTIYLDAPLLSSGFVLVDLPGLHDSNHAREKIAREEQARCDDLMVVSNIARANDNPILRTVIEENASQPKDAGGRLATQSITAVCTFSGVVRPEVDDEDADPEALAAANEKHQKARARKGASWDEVEEAKQERDNVVILARNTRVAAELHDEYGCKLVKGQFHVSCVDNHLFTKDGGMWSDISGIPELQDHTAQLTGKTLFKISYDYTGSEYQAILQAFNAWIAASRARPGTIEVVLPAPNEILAYISSLAIRANALSSCFHKLILETINERATLIAERISTRTEAWRRRDSLRVLGALCRKYGVHIIGKGKDRVVLNLNEELTEAFNGLEGHEGMTTWPGFEEKIEAALDAMKKDTITALKDYISKCTELGAPEHVQNALMARQTPLLKIVSEARKQVNKGWDQMKRRAVKGGELCYVKRALLKTYDDAAGEKGDGCGKTRRRMLEDRVQSRKFVLDVYHEMESDLKTLLDDMQNKMSPKLKLNIKLIEEVIDGFQGKRDNIELFKQYPKFREEAEAAALAANRTWEEVKKLTEPAWIDAVGRWPDILPPLSEVEEDTGNGNMAEDDDAADDDSLEPPAKRIKRERSDSPLFEPGLADDDDEDAAFVPEQETSPESGSEV